MRKDTVYFTPTLGGENDLKSVRGKGIITSRKIQNQYYCNMFINPTRKCQVVSIQDILFSSAWAVTKVSYTVQASYIARREEKTLIFKLFLHVALMRRNCL